MPCRRDFHTYRGYRTKELARMRDFEEERKEAQAQDASLLPSHHAYYDA